MRFLPYQQRWLRDPARIRVMEKSRQIGMTWTAAYDAVRSVSVSERPRDAWISSRDAIQAGLFLDDCRQFANIIKRGADLRRTDYLDTSCRRTSVLSFANGSTIHSLSSNPDAQAGKRGDRILDEFALHPDSQRLYAVAFPGITWGGRLSIISTHRGSHSFFHTLINEARYGDNPKNISLHRVTLEDALRDGFLTRLQSKLPEDDERKNLSADEYLQYVRDRCPDEETFRQEYGCEPADDDTAFLPYPLISSCEHPTLKLSYPPGTAPNLDAPEAPLIRSARWFVGVDVGRTHDRTVIWALASAGDQLLTVRIQILENLPFSEQEEVLWPLLAEPAVQTAFIDESGLGKQFAERATQKFGPRRVRGITFTEKTKGELAWPLRAALEDQKIVLPDDPALRADLHQVRKVIGPDGRTRFTAARNKDGHADRFWALALAFRAARDASSPDFHYTSLSAPSRRTLL